MAKKKTSLGCLFWLALVLLLIVIFLFNQEIIKSVLDKTGFMQVLLNKDEPLTVTINSESEGKDTSADRPEVTEETPPAEISLDTRENPAAYTENQSESESTQSNLDKPNTRKARIFFVSVNNDGSISVKSVIRSIKFDNSPLSETINTLLQGPLSAELNQGILNIIPKGTKLINVAVRGNTAYLNFSDSFCFNPIGQAGLEAQIKQVIYTATEFSNIENVQILIEGKKQDFLSTEGLYIGKPISRESLID